MQNRASQKGTLSNMVALNLSSALSNELLVYLLNKNGKDSDHWCELKKLT